MLELCPIEIIGDNELTKKEKKGGIKNYTKESVPSKRIYQIIKRSWKGNKTFT